MIQPATAEHGRYICGGPAICQKCATEVHKLLETLPTMTRDYDGAGKNAQWLGPYKNPITSQHFELWCETDEVNVQRIYAVFAGGFEMCRTWAAHSYATREAARRIREWNVV